MTPHQSIVSLDAMPDGFAVFAAVRDPATGDIVDFVWTYINDAGAATNRRPAAELVGARVSQIHPGIRASGMFDRYRAVVETGEPLLITRMSYADEGATGMFDLSAWKVGDGFAVTWRDVADREGLFSELLNSEERFRTSVELLHEALSVFEAVRDDTGRIVDFRWTYANPAAAVITGYSAADLEGRLLMDVLPHHGPSGMLDIYRSVVETGRPYVEPSLWYEDIWGDGRKVRRAFDVRASKLQDGFVVVTREVTAEREREQFLAEQRIELEESFAAETAARRKLEAQLQQSQRLESLGQLAGGVAHDFNNLLAAILNYSSFVVEAVDGAVRVAGDDTPKWIETRSDVEQIRRAALRAAELTRKLLAFGRREVVHPVVMSLNDAVAEVEPLLRRTLGEHIHLTTGFAADLWPVLADPGQIEQVLVNLAVNGRDAMPSGGSLTIDTDNVVLDEDMAAMLPNAHPGPYVRIRVSDTGTGMSPEVKARAFEPFFTTKPKGVGTGLGLATVYGIITQAGGTADIYSEPGMGLTFRALFPATSATPGGGPRTVDQPAAIGGKETVLLVEDEDSMREVTRRMLARNGYTVIAAASGPEAIDVIESFPGQVDLVLTDVVMPQLLGQDVAELVLDRQPTARVLFMSGYARPVLAQQGTLAEDTHLLEKPFSEPVLLAKVREVLDRPV